MTPERPIFKLIYEQMDITADISDQLISITYEDKVEGESDEITFTVHDADYLWKTSWYPRKGDKVSLEIGYDDNSPNLQCGTFEVDEVESTGPPDAVTIRALSTGVKGTLRTKKSRAHEGALLRDIAQTIADEHGFTIVDGTAGSVHHAASFTEERRALNEAALSLTTTARVNQSIYDVIIAGILVRLLPVIASLEAKGKRAEAKEVEARRTMLASDTRWELALKNIAETFTTVALALKDFDYVQTISGLDGIRVERVTQNKETDLEFLARVSNEWGLLFSVKDTQLIFMSKVDVEATSGAFTLTRLDLKSYSFRDKTISTFKKAKVSWHNPASKELVAGEIESDSDGSDLSGDDLNITVRAENQQQAERKAQAALDKNNTKTFTGDLTTVGNPLAVSGNNLILTGMGKLSGKWAIVGSRHTLERGQGWECSIDIKKVGDVSESLQTKTPIV